MNKPSRKPNRLKNYDYSSNGMYFITVCAKNKDLIFGKIVGGGVPDAPHSDCCLLSPDSISINLSETGKIVRKHILRINQLDNISVDKYVIMPNHIHLIICIDKPFLSDAMSVKIGGMSGTPSPTTM